MDRWNQPERASMAVPILRGPVAHERVVSVTFSDWEGRALDTITVDDWRRLREYVNLIVDRLDTAVDGEKGETDE